MRTGRPVIVEHSFGDPGSGGPIMTLNRVLESDLATKYELVQMHQDVSVGGINTSMIRDWVRMLRRLRPDLVHVRGLGNEGFHGALAARLAGCPRVLVSIHGTVRDLTQVPNGVRRRVLVHAIEPLTLRMATHLATVCHSAAERDFLAPHRAKLAAVVPNGVRLPDLAHTSGADTRRALGIAQDETVFVVVGRLTFEKGHAVLAKALETLGADAARTTLVLVGDGPDQASISDAYQRVPGLRLHQLGRRQDVEALLQASDVFLFPTLHENLSNALLEGMAAGLPVIASAVGGNVEVLQQGGGLLVPPADPQALAGAITRLLDDAAERKRLGAEARRVVEQGYTVAHMVNRLDELYLALLQDGA